MMNRNFKMIALFVLGLVLSVAQVSTAAAVTMGDIHVYSKTTEQFHAEIPLQVKTGEKIGKIRVTTGDRTDYALQSATDLQSSLVKEGVEQVLVITGKPPAETPFFTLLVAMDLADRTLQRNYSVHLDGVVTPLPTQAQEQAAAAMKAATGGTTPATQSEAGGKGVLYWLLWLGGAVLAAGLFWVWRSQGPKSDENLLTQAKQADSQREVKSWEPLFPPEKEELGRDEALDSAAADGSHDEEVLEEIDIATLTDDDAGDGTEDQAPMAEDAVEPQEELQPDAGKRHVVDASVKSAPGGRLAPAVISGAAAPKKTATKPRHPGDGITISDGPEGDEKMSIESVMHSLERILDNEAGKQSGKMHG